jgi:hypothetical protein
MAIETVTWVKDFIDNTKNHYMIVVKDGATISVPLDSANRDYQEVQDWVADGNSISQAELITQVEAYARKRKAEYPSIEELTVALWEGVVEERMAAVTSLEGKRQAVKAKYPK